MALRPAAPCPLTPALWPQATLRSPPLPNTANWLYVFMFISILWYALAPLFMNRTWFIEPNTTVKYLTFSRLHSMLPYNTLYCLTIPYSILCYSTLPYNRLHCLTIPYNTLHYYLMSYYCLLPYSTLQYDTPPYTTLQYLTLPYYTLHNDPLPFATLV